MHDLTRFSGVTQTEFHFWNYKQDEWCLIWCTTYALGTTTVLLWRRINLLHCITHCIIMNYSCEYTTHSSIKKIQCLAQTHNTVVNRVIILIYAKLPKHSKTSRTTSTIINTGYFLTVRKSILLPK